MKDEIIVQVESDGDTRELPEIPGSEAHSNTTAPGAGASIALICIGVLWFITNLMLTLPTISF